MAAKSQSDQRLNESIGVLWRRTGAGGAPRAGVSEHSAVPITMHVNHFACICFPRCLLPRLKGEIADCPTWIQPHLVSHARRNDDEVTGMHQHDLSTRHGSTPLLTGCDFLQVSSLAAIGNRAIALLDN